MDFKRLEMSSASHSDSTLEALRELVPGAFTETREPSGELTYRVDWDMLRELLGDTIRESDEETFGFLWVGKQEAKRAAAKPTRQTLRPVPEESVDWDTTKNLYIEGDNLEVLKLLQRAYLGRVKMIYIDPPYNTGNDFVYEDDFTMSREEEDELMGNVDEEGRRLRSNPKTAQRYHSDWCSMIYSRLLVARTLLTNDGVIFISIDDNEVHHLRCICDEVFGASNFRNILITRRRTKSLNAQFSEDGLYSLNVGFEYILVYSKSDDSLLKAIRAKKSNAPTKGRWDVFWSNADRPTMRYDILGFTPTSGQWRNSREKAEQAIQNYQTYITEYSQKMSLEEYSIETGIKNFIRRIPNGKGKNGGVQHWIAPSNTVLRTSNWLDIEVSQIKKEIDLPFENPKNRLLIQELIKLSEFTPTDIILDFFSGSATTAHAVMQLNAEDGGKRRYICVQLREETPKDSEAHKAGYDTICEIGKERIRRAGRKIREEHALQGDELDTGFRVLRLDSSNMEDVYFEPSEVTRDKLFELEKKDLVKPGRTELDLLFGCMVDWGVQLSHPMRTEEVDGKRLYVVNEGALVACFDRDITLETIRHIAELAPERVIFRESCFTTDADKLNVYELFKQQCGWSEEEVYRNIYVL